MRSTAAGRQRLSAQSGFHDRLLKTLQDKNSGSHFPEFLSIQIDHFVHIPSYWNLGKTAPPHSELHPDAVFGERACQANPVYALVRH